MKKKGGGTNQLSFLYKRRKTYYIMGEMCNIYKFYNRISPKELEEITKKLSDQNLIYLLNDNI